MNRKEKRHNYNQIKKVRQAEFPLLLVTARLMGLSESWLTKIKREGFCNEAYLTLKREISWRTERQINFPDALTWGTTTGRMAFPTQKIQRLRATSSIIDEITRYKP